MEGKLMDLMKTLNAETFESLIYLKHGLEKVENNFAEGFVMKPAVPQLLANGKPLSIKYKNSRFLEKKTVQRINKEYLN